jgi:tripartite-type tricarboxylate transporter receptor subunit TctC
MHRTAERGLAHQLQPDSVGASLRDGAIRRRHRLAFIGFGCACVSTRPSMTVEPIMRARLVLSLIALVLPLAADARADPLAEFYRGRNVTLIVGYSAGGGYDAYARTVARHLGRHIPGNPAVIPQNMPGAGSLRSANFLYNVAPKDGTAIGHFSRGLAMEPLIGTSATQFDARKFTWLGSGTDEVSICMTWHTSAVKSWNDMLTLPFTVGGEGSGSDPDIFSAVVRNAFGVKLKLVSGYPGSAEVALAIERGEVDGRCGWSWRVSSCSNPTGLRTSRSISSPSSP